MKQVLSDKATIKKKYYDPDDENIKYKLNTEFFNQAKPNDFKAKPVVNVVKLQNSFENDDESIRYKFPKISPNTKPVDRKLKAKPKIKVNFWSRKNLGKSKKMDTNNQKSKRRHTIGETNAPKPKNTTVKVRKRVSFLPSPIFTENHIPMVTVPDDLTIQLNEEEANDLGEDLNDVVVKMNTSLGNKSNNNSKTKSASHTNSNPKGAKRKRSSEDGDVRSQGNENELEFFSKYVVQKLRRMETNQRIYSENLINTVLMLGQLGKLNGKSKILET